MTFIILCSSMDRQTVLFLCTHNSARSQMAEGLLRDRYGDQYDVYSAGVEATEVRPLAIEVMREVDIDLSDHTSTTIDELGEATFDVVVTVCDHARKACPHLPARRLNLHEGVEDPSAVTASEGERRVVFRRVRDALADWIDDTFGDEPGRA